MSVAIKWAFVLVLWAVWATIGTFYWVSLLARAVTTFTGSFLYAMFSDQKTPNIQAQLEYVSDLWVRGFRVAHASLFGDTNDIKPIELRNGRLFIQTVWALTFWSGTILVVFAFHGEPKGGLLFFGHYGKEIVKFIAGAIEGIWRAVGVTPLGWGAVVAIATACVLVGIVLGYSVGLASSVEATRELPETDSK